MPATNGKVIFNEVPTGYPEPGKTVIYDASETIDVESLSLPEGGFVLKTLWVSVDPYMRGRMRKPEVKSYSPPFTLGEAINGFGMGVVVKSKSNEVKEGDHVYGMIKYQNYSVYEKKGPELRVLENKYNLPWSYFVGILGMPGKTAYMAWKEYSRVQKGETVFVSGGAGPVGSFVIQLAKMDGCKVIASAGSAEKVAWMKEVGADVAFNYKEENTKEVLLREGPIDIYWDNVGGETLEAALDAANVNARFIECGMIAGYNSGGVPIRNIMHVVAKSISMHGFIVSRIEPKYVEAFYKEVPELIATGKLKYNEHIYNGLESVGQAILDVQKGANKAKAVVKVAEDA